VATHIILQRLAGGIDTFIECKNGKEVENELKHLALNSGEQYAVVVIPSMKPIKWTTVK
jgi:hypothetical protein